MAKHTPITPGYGPKDHNQTQISVGFAKVLQCLHEFVVAERDLEDVCHSQDPAYSIWARDAEISQEVLTTQLCELHRLPLEIREDIPLSHMALLIDTMIGHEEPGGARRLHRQMQIAFFTTFQTTGLSPAAMHRNGLLIHGRHLIDAMIKLPLFDGVPHGDTASDDDPTDELRFDF